MSIEPIVHCMILHGSRRWHRRFSLRHGMVPACAAFFSSPGPDRTSSLCQPVPGSSRGRQKPGAAFGCFQLLSWRDVWEQLWCFNVLHIFHMFPFMLIPERYTYIHTYIFIYIDIYIYIHIYIYAYICVWNHYCNTDCIPAFFHFFPTWGKRCFSLRAASPIHPGLWTRQMCSQPRCCHRSRLFQVAAGGATEGTGQGHAGNVVFLQGIKKNWSEMIITSNYIIL